MSDIRVLDVVVDADVLGRQRTGDETHVRQVLTELASAQSELSVGAVARKSNLVPSGIHAVELSPFNQVTRMTWQLPMTLRRVGAKLAHFQYIVPPLYRGPSAITIHDLSYELLPELEDRFDGWALRKLVPPSIRRSEVVFTVSEWTKQDIVRRYRIEPERVRVVLNGVGEAFRPDGPMPEMEPYLLFVGALRPRKDPLTALLAYQSLAFEGLRLVMVGPDKGLLGPVRAFIETKGLSERVEIRGHVALEELAALYRGATCVVLPSLYEGFGLPVLEAMASGSPVVATTVGAIPEIAGDAAVLVPPRSAGDLADGIRTAIKDRERLTDSGLARAREFSWQEVARRTLEGYHQAL